MKTFVTALIGATLAVMPAQAHAGGNPDREGDTRRCVSHREPWTTPGGLTRPELERRWDVRGKGRVGLNPIAGRREWMYPLCDMAFPANFASATFSHGRLKGVSTYEVDFSAPTPVPVEETPEAVTVVTR